ncbi:MAG: twin-arginine translocase TatA/TatE family subunit [Labilithrix sp.]|nr:twin-arginine translocase TatA/TatE family subunit [Labilithrix sp.]MCW5811759.1 twin-arginine translocase TatA/TatE family subunit [Labilithrix sp.]
MLGGLGAPELIVIALIALLLFGAGRIADIGKGLGQGIKNFKEGIKEADKDDDDEKSEKPEKTAKKKDADKTEKAEKKEKKEKEEASEDA